MVPKSSVPPTQHILQKSGANSAYRKPPTRHPQDTASHPQDTRKTPQDTHKTPQDTHKTPQDTARHCKTLQDTARHLQDTARDLKKDAWKVIIDIQGCGGGGGGGGGGGRGVVTNFFGRTFYCIFARIVKKQNLEKNCEHFFL